MSRVLGGGTLGGRRYVVTSGPRGWTPFHPVGSGSRPYDARGALDKIATASWHQAYATCEAFAAAPIEELRGRVPALSDHDIEQLRIMLERKGFTVAWPSTTGAA